MRTARSLSGIAILLVLPLFPLPAAAAESVVFDFRSQAAAAALDGAPYVVWRQRGVPLAIQAGLLTQEGEFSPAAADAALAVLEDPVDGARGAGLGVLSEIPSLSFPEEGLSMEEGLLFRFPAGFRATRIRFSDLTQGPDDFGEGAFEAVRLFADGHFLRDVPGAAGGEVAVDLPAGIRVLALTPLLQETDQIPSLSSDPVFYVSSLTGTRVREVPLDLRPAACPNPLNTRSQGKIPAALLGTANLNPLDIDPASIRLAGVAPRRVALADVAGPVAPFTGRTTCAAARKDGRADLTLEFDNQALVRALRNLYGPLRNRQVLVVPLEARLRNGTPLVGEDLVVVHTNK